MKDKSKHGVEFEGDFVLKSCSSIEKAYLEIKIAEIYSANGLIPIAVPEYYSVRKSESCITLVMQKINGSSLIGNNDPELTKKLVKELALFHEIFTQESEKLSSSVIYRDAIPSNYLMSRGRHTHIDFSSSNEYVHCLDDLALLVHPLWSETTEDQRGLLLQQYIANRKGFNEVNASLRNTLNKDFISNRDPNERKEHYQKKLHEMRVGLASGLTDVDFVDLRKEDFETFFTYRTLRGEYYLRKWGDQ